MINIEENVAEPRKKKRVTVRGINKDICLKYSIKKVKQRIPIIEWFPKYKWKSYFIYDFLAGFTMACISVPQGLAFAYLANVDLIYGLNTCCFPAFIYGIFGTAAYSSFGAGGLTSVLVGESVAGLNFEKTDFSKSEFVATLSILIGLYYFILLFFRLYFVVVAFKAPFVSAYLTAIVINILIKALGLILDITQYKTHRGILNLIYTSLSLFSNIKYTNLPTLFLSVVILLFFTFNYFVFSPWFKKKTSVVFPIESVTMLLAIFFSYVFGFSKYGISLVGHVPTGLPELTVPNLSAFKAAWLDGLTIAVVNYATTITNLIWFNEHVDNEQEVFAIAISNLICAWIQCYAVGNSMMRAMVAWSIGLKTLLAQIISSFFMIFIVGFGGPVFSPLPRAVLGCIMFTAATKLLYMRVKEVKKFYKSFEDVFIYIITFSATVLTTTEIGLFVGLVFSLRKILEGVAKAEDEEKEVNADSKPRSTTATEITMLSDEISEPMVLEQEEGEMSPEEKRKSRDKSKSLMRALRGRETTEEPKQKTVNEDK